MSCVLALGSNLGDRVATLAAAADRLGAIAVSPVYETEPVGGPAQDDFLNAVVIVPDAAPAALLEQAHDAEQAAHRVRTVRNGPRTLDVDVIVAGDVVSDDPVLTLPHPRAHERAFVLAPWRDLEPDAVLPGYGRIADLLAALQADDGTPRIRRTAYRLAAGPPP